MARKSGRTFLFRHVFECFFKYMLLTLFCACTFVSLFVLQLVLTSTIRLPDAPCSQFSLLDRLSGFYSRYKLFDLYAYETPAAFESKQV